MRKLFGALFALVLSAVPALAQNQGTVAAGAYAIGKGPGVTGYSSLLCSAGQLAVGQAGAPICRTINGDATVNAAGALTLASIIAPAGPIGTATAAPVITYDAKGRLTVVTTVTITPAIGSITGMGAGCGTFLTTPTSANLRGCLTDESGAGLAYFQGGDIGTPSAGNGSNLVSLNASQLASGIVPNARLNATIRPEGRLTLTSATPVLTATVSGATSVIYALYNGNLVPIYDGTNFTPTAIAELSNVNANSATGSAGPAAVANNSCYDYFVWSNAGTPTLTRGPAWTSTTARSAGTALVRINGIQLNSVAITNGPAIQRGTYVGTGCSNGTATFDYIFGGSGSGGVAASFGIWNMYNRVRVSTTVFDTGAGYTYSSATVRQARASAGNQISFVAGLVEEGFNATVIGQVNTAATLGSTGFWGVGLNNSAAFAAGRTFGSAPTAATFIFGAPHTANLTPQLGLNNIVSNEAGDGVTTVTFNNNSLNNLSANLSL